MEGSVDSALLEKASEDRGKEHAILEACRWRNLGDLRALAESPGGLLTDSLRQQAWPLLLGLPPKEGQVQLDVDRSFIYYPLHKSDAELNQQKQELSSLILEVLRRHPYLCYFQGYHDICQVLLLVLPPPVRAPAVARLSALRIRDFMLPSLSPAVAQLRLIPDILRAADPALWRHLSATEPFFALSGTLTMYAHDITTLGEIARLFDVLLAREPVFSVYMFAAIVRGRRDELFDTPADEPEILHSILSKLPRPLDLEGLVAAARQLFNAHPPSASPPQTMRDAEVFFRRQVRELEWKDRRDRLRETLWYYRRPAACTLGIAAMVGIVAVLLRPSATAGAGGPLAYISSLLARWGR
ncbi:rab-GTPase-TBC domain-containing protein [Bombardia bombarda]|uniref:Rab-GTPase-TBC domain-containing protein n=1 Tax=Bombardia bombarda TaxID=252184 RepID=A0AA39X9F9_9PEZI|nr:rab-GTPase-TBC domain-containing protein [Bombardia bombarda]